ncbi:hypothetical protein RB12314 [Rhodopirellula baltica SH 1]|uniref:Uncharacterized protein n=1 Tax=Rhodopirellula baltica (strain DSM 10527 / NCIMB 13988 / SH1) TaxID=243090 RepID=Q7UIV1_RHOBA|nr:hypothetical protein RB12314 [Rhodopirellula baltica SH 1]
MPKLCRFGHPWPFDLGYSGNNHRSRHSIFFARLDDTPLVSSMVEDVGHSNANRIRTTNMIRGGSTEWPK